MFLLENCNLSNFYFIMLFVFTVFTECCRREGGLMTFKCKKELNDMKACMERWFTDEQFKQECTQMYLNRRKEFRLASIKGRLAQVNQEGNKDEVDSSSRG